MPSSDPIINDLDTRLSIEVDPKATPKGNKFGTRWINQLDLGNNPVLLWGRIVDALAYLHLYKVQVEDDTAYWCSAAAMTGFQPYGARSLNTLPLGTGVYIIRHPRTFTSTIIAADPDYVIDNKVQRSDYISQGSRCGITTDECYRSPLELTLQGNYSNFSAGRPIDGLHIGEWGATTETGLMVQLDPFMYQARVDEETGLWLFYYDSLARLAGHNLQIRSAGVEKEYFDDESEISIRENTSSYYHESLGVLSYDTDAAPTIYVDHTPEEVQQTKTEYSDREPIYDDQQPYARLNEYRGYLGSAYKRILSLPPDALPDDDFINRYSLSRKFPGVFEENLYLTGAWSVRSAKRIILAKRPCIPVPKEIIRPEDKRGDNSSNYKAAGIYGDGVDHIINADLIPDNTEDAPLEQITAAAIEDINALIWNREGVVPFYYHTRDWYLPEEDEGDFLYFNMELPSFASLATSNFLTGPTVIPIKVDDRYHEVDYVPNTAHIALLDGGGISICDGFGFELKTGNGNSYLSTPGDMFIQSGRNVNMFAGWDAIIKAYNSADITADRKDVRLKAKHNVMIMGGNDGCGGVLIESRAVCPSFDYTDKVGEDVITTGITLRAPNSYVMSYGSKIISVTNKDSNPTGDIILDAGDNKIKTYSKYFERFVETAIFDFFGGESCTSTNEYWANVASIGSPLDVNGGLLVDGKIETNNWVLVNNGHIMTSMSDTYNNKTLKLTGSDLGNLVNNFTNLNNRFTNTAGICSQERDQDFLDSVDGILEQIEFSLRIPEQYKSQNFMLFESRWQQLARLNNETMPKWSDDVVTYNQGSWYETYAYPGKEPILGDTFREIDLKLFDVVNGVSIDRTSALYENPVFEKSTASPLTGNYSIIMSG